MTMTKRMLEKIFDQRVLFYQEITIGWSGDTKYIVRTKKGVYVLRLARYEEYDKKSNEFDVLLHCYDLGLPVSNPIKFGAVTDQFVYYIVEYIEGDQAEVRLKEFTPLEQYNFGIEMGQTLKVIHQIEVTSDDKRTWEEIYTKKIHSRIEAYKQSEVKNDKIEAFISFVLENISLLKNRPITQSHGDFHVGNMIIDLENKIHLIDFNRVKLGDPLYEFNRIYFSFKKSPSFAKGTIDGYFNKEVPEYFFLYMKFYMLSVMIGNIVWASQFEQEDIDYAINAINEVYDEYNGLKNTVPKWYEDAKKMYN